MGEGQLRKTLSRGLVRERGEVVPVHRWGGRARVGSHRPGVEPARAERYSLDMREPEGSLLLSHAPREVPFLLWSSNVLPIK